jgi:hypothetical protein
MNVPFFRKPTQIDEGDILSNAQIDEQSDILAQWQTTVVTPRLDDSLHKVSYGRIGLVSVEENTQLPALLRGATQSALMQRIMLPRNPRIASDELYQLDGMDYIVMLTRPDRRITKDIVRWLNRLKQLRIPMVLLLPYVAKKRHEQEKIDLFSKHVGVPVVSITAQNVNEARQQFIVTTMQIAPAMGLALAAQLPNFRSPLMQNLLEKATEDSLSAQDTKSVQLQMVSQICAAYGCNGHQFELHQPTMETLVAVINHYTKNFVKRFPMKDEASRARLTHSLSTLFIAHATAIHFGATPPSLFKVLLPQIWRLYRASRRPIST